MKTMNVFVCAALTAFFVLSTNALAGDLEPVAAPDNATSAMYTLDDLYNRLATGDDGTKRSGGAVEPGAAPESTGKTLDEIMAAMPQGSESPAGVDDVQDGKDFWSLDVTEGRWGLKQGTRKEETTCPFPCIKTVDGGNEVCRLGLIVQDICQEVYSDIWDLTACYNNAEESNRNLSENFFGIVCEAVEPR